MISHDELVTMARKACEGSLRPTYCKDLANFYPHLWVIEAMKMAYERGYADAQRRDMEALVDHVDGLAAHVVERLNKLSRDAEDWCDGSLVKERAAKALEEECDFLVVHGKIVKDRGGTGVWPPKKTDSEMMALVGFKDLSTGATVYGTSPAGWYGKGTVESHRQISLGGYEYYVRFIGRGGADWYSSHRLDASPRYPITVKPIDDKQCTSPADVCECPPEAVRG